MAMQSDGPSWRCRLGLHHWPAWSRPADDVLVRTSCQTGINHPMRSQERTCARCNRHEVRAVLPREA